MWVRASFYLGAEGSGGGTERKIEEDGDPKKRETEQTGEHRGNQRDTATGRQCGRETDSQAKRRAEGFFSLREPDTQTQRAKMFKRGLRFGLFDCLIFGVFCVWFAFVDRPGSAATRRGGRRPYPEWARRGSAYSPAQSRRSVLQSVAKHQSTCATHEQKERLHTAYVVCVMGKGGGGGAKTVPRTATQPSRDREMCER